MKKGKAEVSASNATQKAQEAAARYFHTVMVCADEALDDYMRQLREANLTLEHMQNLARAKSLIDGGLVGFDSLTTYVTELLTIRSRTITELRNAVTQAGMDDTRLRTVLSTIAFDSERDPEDARIERWYMREALMATRAAVVPDTPAEL